MSHIKTCLAYGWAALAVPIVLATFMGMEPLAAKLVAATGLHVHPIYTGGEVAQTIDHGPYRTLVHRPVFDGLVGQRENGFIQIKWQLKDPNAPNLPETIDELIDFDTNGSNDLRILLNPATRETRIEILDLRVLSVDRVIAVPDGWIVRANLRRTP
jgi:hypothetical protein